MSTPNWSMTGPCVASCNCDWGCPCQFNALPSNGDCRAAVGMQITKGTYEGVSLSNLKWVALFAWPEAIHMGNGECIPVIDVNANEGQRNALLQILSGAASKPGTTVFDVFASTVTKMHDPVFADITFECDLENLTGKMSVPGILETSIEPIHNPVTNEIHRISLDLPNGIEYKTASVVSSSTKSDSAIPLHWNSRHGHMYTMNMGPTGPIS